jgi:hypothetical protein
MTKRDRITTLEAMSLWEQLHKEGKTALSQKPDMDNLRKLALKYEGLMSFRNVDQVRKWYHDKDIFLEYMTKGFPDVATLSPVMKVEVALRYLRQNGVGPSYKLRDLRKDLEANKWIIRGTNGARGDRVTRSHLNKILGWWNGNEQRVVKKGKRTTNGEDESREETR